MVRDARAVLVRYGVGRGERLDLEKDALYVAAASRIFAADPSVTLFVYGHTHIPSQREVDGRYVINTGTWLSGSNTCRSESATYRASTFPRTSSTTSSLPKPMAGSASDTGSSPRRRRTISLCSNGSSSWADG